MICIYDTFTYIYIYIYIYIYRYIFMLFDILFIYLLTAPENLVEHSYQTLYYRFN